MKSDLEVTSYIQSDMNQSLLRSMQSQFEPTLNLGIQGVGKNNRVFSPPERLRFSNQSWFQMDNKPKKLRHNIKYPKKYQKYQPSIHHQIEVHPHIDKNDVRNSKQYELIDQMNFMEENDDKNNTNSNSADNNVQIETNKNH